MPASNHTIAGTVQAIQYTGSNVADIMAALGSTWTVYTSTGTTTIAPCQVGNEQYALNSLTMKPTQWIVSLPAYSNQTPALSGGFMVLTDAQFAQQYV